MLTLSINKIRIEHSLLLLADKERTELSLDVKLKNNSYSSSKQLVTEEVVSFVDDLQFLCEQLDYTEGVEIDIDVVNTAAKEPEVVASIHVRVRDMLEINESKEQIMLPLWASEPDNPQELPTLVFDCHLSHLNESESGNEYDVHNETKERHSNHYEDYLWPEYCNPAYVMPDTIEVRVSLPSGDYFFPVKVHKFTGAKIYLGGYRNKRSGKIYHHSSSQTPIEVKNNYRNTQNLRTRETQTTETRSLSLQTLREIGTQMERNDLIQLDKTRDKVIFSSKRYVTADYILGVKKLKVVVIQRYWRGYIARCKAHEIRMKNDEKNFQILQEKEETFRQQRAKKEDDMKRRLRPKSNADFEILYNELDAWRRGEIAKIKESDQSAEEKSVQYAKILTEETDALQSIEKLKMLAYRDIQTNNNEKVLALMAKPKLWQLSNGDIAQVQTPDTARAKEFYDLYKCVTKPLLDNKDAINDRLDALLRIKNAVLPYCGMDALAKDIMDLVDREADLLNRGRPLKSLESLRMRLQNLFLSFVKNPTYNPCSKEYFGNGSHRK